MVLTNAERQKRFRERLKARVNGADLPEQARTAIDAGLAAVWSVLVRNADKVAGGLDAFSDFDAFKAAVVGKPDDMLSDFEAWSSEDGEPLDITNDERSAMILAAGVCRAVLLKHVPAPLPAKRQPRGHRSDAK